jgi:hypothetical protein
VQGPLQNLRWAWVLLCPAHRTEQGADCKKTEINGLDSAMVGAIPQDDAKFLLRIRIFSELSANRGNPPIVALPQNLALT